MSHVGVLLKYVFRSVGLRWGQDWTPDKLLVTAVPLVCGHTPVVFSWGRFCAPEDTWQRLAARWITQRGGVHWDLMGWGRQGREPPAVCSTLPTMETHLAPKAALRNPAEKQASPLCGTYNAWWSPRLISCHHSLVWPPLVPLTIPRLIVTVVEAL